MSVIADLIRAGVDPDLVARVHDEIVAAAKQPAAPAHDAYVDEQAERRRAKDRARKRLVRGVSADVPQKSADNGAESDLAREDITTRAPAVIPVGISNDIPPLFNPDLKIGPLAPKEPARSARSILFDRFYAAYPKHTNRKAAEAKFLSAVRSGVDAERIISAAARFADATRRAGTEKQFIPAPDVWLNKGKYGDADLPEPVTPEARAGPSRGNGWAADILGMNFGEKNEPSEPERRDSEIVSLLPAVGEVGNHTGGDDDFRLSGGAVELYGRRNR